MNGECVFEDPDAEYRMLTDYKIAIITDGTLLVIDREGGENYVDVGLGACVDTALGMIAVTTADGTVIYDEDLNIVTSVNDIYTDNGYCPGYIYDDANGMFYFVSFSDDSITNVLTGQTVTVPVNSPDEYYYDYEYGYIIADNMSDGNHPDKHWFVYDADLNLIMCGDGICRTFRDELTGEVYLSVLDNGVSTFYILCTGTELFSLDGDWAYRYSRAYDEVFYISTADQCALVDNDGEFLFEYDIA